jgi:hypothetical protein
LLADSLGASPLFGSKKFLGAIPILRIQPKTTRGIVYFLVNGKGVGLHDEKSQDDMALVESTISHEEFNVYTPK